MRQIFRFLNQYSNVKRKADKIKSDVDKRQKSIHFGITSILTSLFAMAFCILGAWFFKAFTDTGLVIFTIILGITFILCGVILFVWALIRLIFQFGINKNWSGWLSLFLFFACIAGSVIAILNFK